MFACKLSKLSQTCTDYKALHVNISSLYYKLMVIVNYDSRVINKLEASLTDNARVVIYEHHMFIVQTTG